MTDYLFRGSLADLDPEVYELTQIEAERPQFGLQLLVDPGHAVEEGSPDPLLIGIKPAGLECRGHGRMVAKKFTVQQHSSEWQCSHHRSQRVGRTLPVDTVPVQLLRGRRPDGAPTGKSVMRIAVPFACLRAPLDFTNDPTVDMRGWRHG